jgi:hypothetical protein
MDLVACDIDLFFYLFIYLLKLRGHRGKVARPIIAVHIKYYKYVLQKLTVGAIFEIWTLQWFGKGDGWEEQRQADGCTMIDPRGSCAFPLNLNHLQTLTPPTQWMICGGRIWFEVLKTIAFAYETKHGYSLRIHDDLVPYPYHIIW